MTAGRKMNVKSVVALTFDGRKDGELLAKLNAAAAVSRRKSHTLARAILLEHLNRIIDENSIDWQEWLNPAGGRPG